MNATSNPPEALDERRKLFRNGDLVAGRYRILRFVARGGMGEVYAAEDEDLGQEVALKAVRPEVAIHAQTLDRFRREINLSRQVTHHHVCRIYDAGTHLDEELELSIRFLTMELLGGKTLTRHLRESGPMTTDEVFPIAVQVASGLAAAHNAGVVHRDFKASNVLLTNTGRGTRAVITDFGLSRRLHKEGESQSDSDQLTGTGQLMGTLAYLAPEQLEGKTATPATDIYSFGVVLFQMITGRLPFEGGSPLMAALKRLHEDPPDPADLVQDLDPTWRQVLLRCLRRDPDERYQSCEALLEDLGVEILNDSSTSHERPVFDTLGSGPVALPIREDDGEPEERPDGNGKAERVVPLWKATVGAILVGLAVAVASFLTPEIAETDPTLRVAVSPPMVVGGDGADYAASGFESALLRGLGNLEGVSAVDPGGLGSESPGESPAELMERTAADEVMSLQATKQGREWRIVLKRYGPDAEVLWTEEFPIPDDDHRLQADAIQAMIRSAYPRMAPRSGGESLPISDHDYEKFLRLRYLVETGAENADWRDILAEFDELAERSPDFVEIHLYRARVALALYLDGRKEGYRSATFSALEQARRVAPEDPRPLLHEVDAGVRSGELDQARQAIKELRLLAPGEVSTLAAEARISQAEGDLESALQQMKRVVRIRPARRYLYDLAKMQLNAGRIEDARDSLEALLTLWPEYSFGREQLAALELLHGDLDRALELFTALVQQRRDPSILNNFAILHLLQGRYEEAVEIYRELDQEYGGNPEFIIGWADAASLAGDTGRAEELYERTLRLLPPIEECGPYELLVRGQALAQLGRDREAIESIDRSLATGSGRGQVHLWSSLVFILVDDLERARIQAAEARRLGIPERWFDLPWFDPLQTGDP